MKHHLILLLAGALALAACSGNFSTGTGMPNTIPQGNESMPPYGQNGIPAPMQSISPLPSGSPAAAAQSTYRLADASQGFACPQTVDGYSCLLRFNVPPPTPSPSPGTKASTPTASPSPSPTPSPSPISSGSPAATPSPTPTPPSLTLTAQVLPSDAPPMYHTPASTLDVVPLIMVHLEPNADFLLDGAAYAQFELPKDQLPSRKFAVQLFQMTTHKKRTNYKPIWTFDKSTLKKQTLTFGFTPPKMTIPKNSTYVMVLYGDAIPPSSAPSGAPTASGSPTELPTDFGSPLPSASP